MALSPQELKIVEYGKAQGKSKEQVLSAIVKFRSSTPIQPQTPQVSTQISEPNALQRVSDVISGAGNEVQSQIAGQGKYADQGALQRGFGATASAFNAVPQVAVALAPQPVRSVLSAVGKGYENVINWLGDKLGSTQLAQDFVIKHPDAAKSLEEVASVGKSSGDIANTILLSKGTTGTAQKVTDLTKKTGNIPSIIGSGIDETASIIGTGIEKAKNLTTQVVKNESAKNVSPQLQTSVENIVQKSPVSSQVSGASKTIKDPLKLYNEFIVKEQKFKTDSHADTALGSVGERTGKEFEGVIKTRQAFGKVMGDELKSIGNIKTETHGVFENFRTELRDSGVAYDVTNRKLSQIANQTKFDKTDLTQIGYYGKELQRLGKNPTVSELDAFMSRIPKTIDVYKASKAIIGTTNAERIIKGSLAQLRKSLLESSNPALEKYSIARSKYAQLSSFIDEGVSYLGKKTVSGDYSRDASILKSSIQSILNGGKKDWLIKLEQITGYNALDEAVLALQAMKDVGNFRGQSLLDLLSPSEIPVTKTGAVGKVIDYALEKGTSKLLGTPIEQTRRFIQETAQKKNAPKITNTANANQGATTNNINQSSNFIQPNITTLSPEVQRVINIKK